MKNKPLKLSRRNVIKVKNYQGEMLTQQNDVKAKCYYQGKML